MTVPPPDEVLVPLARGRLDRVWVPVIALNALIVLAVVAGLVLLVTHGVLALLPPIVLILLVVVSQLGLATTVWLGLRRIRTPIELRRDGVTLRVTGGAVTAPWDAVASVTFERGWFGRRVRFRFVPPTDERYAGVRTDLSKGRAKVLDRQGLVYALRVLDTDPELLREQLSRRTSGTTPA